MHGLLLYSVILLDKLPSVVPDIQRSPQLSLLTTEGPYRRGRDGEGHRILTRVAGHSSPSGGCNSALTACDLGEGLKYMGSGGWGEQKGVWLHLCRPGGSSSMLWWRVDSHNPDATSTQKWFIIVEREEKIGRERERERERCSSSRMAVEGNLCPEPLSCCSTGKSNRLVGFPG